MDITDTNALLTRVGPGTPMGELMRQYWVPAIMSSELQRDAPPTRLMLLGEQLIAFRDSSGRVGIMDHRCPHRCASLFVGRNEADGIRCVYHGWKFDVEGKCLDQPNLPPAQRFTEKVHAKAYKTAERNGLIWVYMGRRKEAPPLPAIECTLVPEDEIRMYCMQREANWLQTLEGDLDTAHFGFLHMGSIDPDDLAEDNMLRNTAANRTVELKVTETPWGTAYGAHRLIDGRVYWRYANFMFPFWAQAPQGDFEYHVDGGAFVPMDDTHTMVFRFHWKKEPTFLKAVKKDGSPLPMIDMSDHPYLPNTTDWHGRWRPAANASNDWQIDRQAQSSGLSFTGIRSLYVQDQVAVESAGPIVDHSFEHLGPTDQMVARTRRRLMKAALALRDQGTVPPGVDDFKIFLESRGGQFITEVGVDWQDAYRAKLLESHRPGVEIVERGDGSPSALEPAAG
jgi:phenylpropionate dioxygenase-like ring-hydroxylating dioxygenase large terminal subunit